MESVVLRSNSGWEDLHIYEGSTLAALVLSPRRGGGPTRRGGTDIREDNLMPSLEDWLFELYSQLFKYYSPASAGGVEERQVFSRQLDGTQPPPTASEYLLTNSTRPNHSKHKYGRTCLFTPRGDAASEEGLTNESREPGCSTNHRLRWVREAVG